MNEERLWAPWRLEYVTGDQSEDPPPEPATWLAGADRNCFLCRAAAEFDSPDQSDRQLLVVDRKPLSVLVLNRYPYNNGHLLVAPRRHIGELGGLTPDEHLACMEDVSKLIYVYREHIKAEGFNVGLNLGRVAGAGLPGHLHWHLVPRWSGDTNFMPVLAGARVIPQSLDSMWALLVEALGQKSGG